MEPYSNRIFIYHDNDYFFLKNIKKEMNFIYCNKKGKSNIDKINSQSKLVSICRSKDKYCKVIDNRIEVSTDYSIAAQLFLGFIGICHYIFDNCEKKCMNNYSCFRYKRVINFKGSETVNIIDRHFSYYGDKIYCICRNIFCYYNNYSPFNFVEKINECILNINSGCIGRKLIKKIENGKYRVLIRYENGKIEARSFKINETNEGPSIINISKTPDFFGIRGERIKCPTYIALAHELIHAYRFSRGKDQDIESMKKIKYWENENELIVITGDPKQKYPRISENGIRKEHGLPLRFSHMFYYPLKEKERLEFQEAALNFSNNFSLI